MAPRNPKAAKSHPTIPEPPKEYPTIAAQHEAEYLASRSYQVLKDTKGLLNLSSNEKSAYTSYKFLESGTWRTWTAPQQKEFWKTLEQQKIPIPLPKSAVLGKDSRGVDLESYTPADYRLWEKKEKQIRELKEKSERFREKRERSRGEESPIGAVEDERNRRKLIGVLQGKKMGRYEGDPSWDDVIPIPQDDGEGALAQIAYTDEYAEATGYLRAIMAAKEHSPRVLSLTEHIITMNAAHYTVWLYRCSTLLALSSPIDVELQWVNNMALDNQKNYQIWHHRQVLVDALYNEISSNPTALKSLATSEIDFMTEMFNEDSKNYHVWSYRHYLVRKLCLWGERELKDIEKWLKKDVRNNSAWSHRFFVVFSDPSYTTKSSQATEYDPAIPSEIIHRELEFAKAATFEAPQNQSPWNYIRGVLKKGGEKLGSLEDFASQFVNIGESNEEDVKSSHALDFLADIWAERGENQRADLALRLLGDRYDRVRKHYWDWRRGLLKEEGLAGSVKTLGIRT